MLIQNHALFPSFVGHALLYFAHHSTKESSFVKKMLVNYLNSQNFEEKPLVKNTRQVIFQRNGQFKFFSWKLEKIESKIT